VRSVFNDEKTTRREKTHDELLAFAAVLASRARGCWKSLLGQRGRVNLVA
jgi:hypothetical protein